MSKWNTGKRNRRASVAWQAVAFALLLLPITAPIARGQFVVTVSIVLNSQVAADEPVQDEPAQREPAQVEPAQDDPAPKPAETPSEPQPAVAEAPPAPVPPVAPSEPAVEKPATQESAQDKAPAASSSTASSAAAATPSVPEAKVESAPQEAATTSGQSTESKSTSEPTTLPEPASETQPTVTDKSDTRAQQPKETQLSVEPGATLLPTDRPAWISNEMDLKSATHRFVVSSFPTARESEVDSNLDACLEEAARNYVIQLLNDDSAGELLDRHLSAAFVRTNLLDDKTTYLAELSTTGGVMFQKWVMVEVTKEQQEQIRTWYQEQVQRRRMIPLAIGIAGLVALVGVGNLMFRRSASKSQQTPMMKVVGSTPAGSCCGKRGGWGYAFAIVVAIVVAALVKG